MVLTSTRSRSIVCPVVSLGFVLTAGWLPPQPLAAQAPEATDRGVVIHASVTEETIPRELTEEEADAIEGALATVQNVLCRLGNMVPGDMVPEGEMGMAFGMGRFAICEAEVDIPEDPPEPVHSNYTIYIRDDLMTVEVEDDSDLPKMVWQAVEGQQSKMWFVDPSTGERITFGPPGGMQMEVAPLRTVDERTPLGQTEVDYGASPTGETGELLSYRVREYKNTRRLAPGGAEQLNALMIDVSITSSGRAWIAPETPYNGVVAGFFENFAAGTESPSGGGLGGLTASMAELTGLGLPLKTVDTTSVRILTGAGGGGLSAELEKTVDTTVITSIRWEDIPDEQFWGDDPPPDGTDPGDPAATPFETPDDCNCSCEAMRELENLDEDDPGALAAAMCAQQCVADWMQCGE